MYPKRNQIGHKLFKEESKHLLNSYAVQLFESVDIIFLLMLDVKIKIEHH